MKEVYVSSPVVRQLLTLMRASMWQTNVDCLPFMDSNVDWDEIGRLSMQQTIGGLVITAALSLPGEISPSKDWLIKGYTFLERNKRTHILLDECVAEVCKKLKEIGISSVLLKGQAYARAYPDPTLRQCGDIDLYVGEENYLKAYEAANGLGWECKGEFNPDAKHSNFRLRGVDIELHRIAGQFLSHKCNVRFQEWSRKQLEESQNSIIIGVESITVPSPIFNVVFVFMHMFLHFLSGGIGLRHVCDWVMLLHAHSKDINIEELERCLNDFGLLKSWKLFTPLAVDYLGLPADECPLYSPKYNKNAERILYFILKEGNFGRAERKISNRPKGYFAGKSYSFIKTTERRMRKFWIDPQTVTRNYYSFVFNGVRRVVSDISSKKLR